MFNYLVQKRLQKSILVMHFLSITAEIPNLMGMGNVSKILEKKAL